MSAYNKDFWFGKRVLVTGADGFAASHLIKALVEKKAVVIGTTRHNRPSKGPVKYDLEQSDLLDYQEVRRICDRHQVDTIFHLAATAIVSNAANSPMSTIENNVIPTLNLLEVARVNKIPRIIIASTDKSYGDHASSENEKIPYREEYALRGLDVYSASKVCTDMIAQTYAFQFGLPIVVTRSCNMYGPGDLNFTRLIPRTIMCLLSGKPPVINLGNEKVLREYIYIGDVVKAYLMLAENIESYYGPDNCNMPKSGAHTYGWPAFNFGSYGANDLKNITHCDKIKSVHDVITILRSKIANIEPQTIEKPSNFIEIPDQYLDSSKLQQLGFIAETPFEEGLEATIKWYKDNYNELENAAFKYITH